MSFCVCTSAMLQCPFGDAPVPFTALPTPKVVISGQPMGVLSDMAPTTNIPPFGMCKNLGNPSVASATTAAGGVLTPVPCVPVPAGPWLSPSPKVLVGGRPALTSESKLMCAWGGQISVQYAGQTSVQL